jgi:hypothetical protein
MSWIIQTILRNREVIRTRQDIESDEFNNLLTIESKIDELYKEGFLSDIDLCIINLVADGRSISELEGRIGKSRITISKTFIQLCERIAYFLGDYFTDEGFLNNMKDDYKLSEDDLDRLRVHMSGKFKHKLMRSK